MPKFFERVQNAWNAFRGRDRPVPYEEYGGGSYYRPDRTRLLVANERSIVTSIFNRIANDVAAVQIMHVKVDQNGWYKETVEDGLNNVLTLEANIDQTSREFVRDVVLSMFENGCVAIVPVNTTKNPVLYTDYDILSMRAGPIVQWYPKHVRVCLYNDATGRHEEVTLPKSVVGVVANPFYSVMNEPNSTLQRLIRKLSLLDTIDEQSGAGKLDLIIQLPYLVKNETRRAQAEKRRKDIEEQLSGSKYGIAYTDGTEHITQLNRSVDNNIMHQVEYLTDLLYSQLGITAEVMNGTADEKTMLNYNNRTVEPILAAIADELKRKFLTKTARTQGHSIVFIQDPFKLVPINNIADIADKFTRNEILSSNELRQIVGFKPVDDDRANELRNKNLNQSSDAPEAPTTDDDQNGISLEKT